MKAAIARPCLDVLLLAARLTLEHKAGLTELVRGMMRSGTGDGGAVGLGATGASDPLDLLKAMAEAVLEMMGEGEHEEGGGGGRKGSGAGGHEKAVIARDERIGREPPQTTATKRRRSGKAGRALQPAQPEQPSQQQQLCLWQGGCRSAVPPLTARARVMGDGFLLQHAASFLAGPDRPSRHTLGRMRRVCRVWVGVCGGEALWRPIAEALVPMLGTAEGGEVVRARGEGFGAWLREHGRSIVERRVAWVDSWYERLELYVEVWDERDGLRILSVLGHVQFDHGSSSLYMSREPTCCHACPPFSAASRSTEGHQYDSIEEYFLDGHNDASPTDLRVRVSVWDRVTGRAGLLWESAKDFPGGAYVLEADIPGTLTVCCGIGGQGRCYVRGVGQLSIEFYFQLEPEVGQEVDVPEGQKLYRASFRHGAGYEQSSVGLSVEGDVENAIALVHAALRL